MSQKIPRSPFTTRLSGSAKETELRIRNIFQWKKKRPPVALFLLTAVLVLSCFGLVSCQVEPNVQTPDPVVTPSPTLGEPNQNAVPTPTPEDPDQDAAVNEIPPLSPEEFFSCYVTDFPDYTDTGWKTSDHNRRVLTIEDTPNNLAEATVIDWHRLNWMEETKKLDLICGNESLLLGSPSSFQTYTIHKLSTLPPDDFTVENMPFLDAFYRWLSKDIREFGLTEYTIVYADLSWEWTPEQLALGPQLGNGRYERLYLVGKTAPDTDWKLYEVYWGEQIYNRLMSPAASVWQGQPISFMGGNITILPPESWKGKVGYEEGNGEISFYHLATSTKTGYEGAGNLYNVRFSSGQIYGLNYSFPWPGGVIAVSADGTYWYGTPSDVQYIPSTEEEYTRLFAQAGEMQFILSDELQANSLNKDNPDVPELISTTRKGRTMAVTANTVMTNCYSYSSMYHSDPSTYHWFSTDTQRTLYAGDIVLVLEEMDGMSRVVIPYGDVPWLYGFVDSNLLSDDKADVFAAVGHVNQAIIAYEVASYSAPGGTGTPDTMYPCRVEILEMQNGWAKVQPLGTGEDASWVDSSHLYYGFADDPVLDAPAALNFIP